MRILLSFSRQIALNSHVIYSRDSTKSRGSLVEITYIFAARTSESAASPSPRFVFDPVQERNSIVFSRWLWEKCDKNRRKRNDNIKLAAFKFEYLGVYHDDDRSYFTVFSLPSLLFTKATLDWLLIRVLPFIKMNLNGGDPRTYKSKSLPARVSPSDLHECSRSARRYWSK